MQNARALQIGLAFAVLALAILGYGDDSSPLWGWTAIVGAALALVAFADAWVERARLWQEPWTVRLTADVAAGLVLPVLAAAALLAAWAVGDVWLDVAIVLVVALAVATLV